MTHPTEQATPSRESRLREAVKAALHEYATGRHKTDHTVDRILAAVLPLLHEGVEDSADLDWLERFLQIANSSVFTSPTGQANERRNDDTDDSEWNHPYHIGYQVEQENRGCYRWEELSNGCKHLRGAIRAARQAAKD